MRAQALYRSTQIFRMIFLRIKFSGSQKYAECDVRKTSILGGLKMGLLISAHKHSPFRRRPADTLKRAVSFFSDEGYHQYDIPFQKKNLAAHFRGSAGRRPNGLGFCTDMRSTIFNPSQMGVSRKAHFIYIRAPEKKGSLEFHPKSLWRSMQRPRAHTYILILM